MQTCLCASGRASRVTPHRQSQLCASRPFLPALQQQLCSRPCERRDLSCRQCTASLPGTLPEELVQLSSLQVLYVAHAQQISYAVCTAGLNTRPLLLAGTSLTTLPSVAPCRQAGGLAFCP